MTPSIRWQLRFGDQVIADAYATDWPWTYGTLVDSPHFEKFRKYFSDWDLYDDDDPEKDELITNRLAVLHKRGWEVRECMMRKSGKDGHC